MPNTAPDCLHVAVGVIVRENRILLARRADHQHQGGLWEFPGGKVEASETVQQALRRELYEELGLDVEPAGLAALMDLRHCYPDRSVRLDVWWVRQFAGQPHGREGQPLAWVAVEELHKWSFPAANQPIVNAVQAHFPHKS